MVNIIKSRRTLEGRVFDKLKPGENEVPVLIFSGLKSMKTVDKYRAKLDRIEATTDKASKIKGYDISDPLQLLAGTYVSLEDPKYRRYTKDQNNLIAAIDNQLDLNPIVPVGDCIAQTELYNVLMSRKGIDLEILSENSVEDDAHHLSLWTDQGEKTFIDHTANPGFNISGHSYSEYNVRGSDFILPLTLFTRGKKLMSKDDNQAIEYFSKAIELEPKFGNAYLHRAIARLGTGSLIQARWANKDLETARQYGFNSGNVHLNLGISESMKSNYKKAFFSLSRAITMEPEIKKAHLERGKISQKANHHSAAIRDFNEEIKNNPENPRAYHRRGISNYELENYNEAKADLEEAIALGGSRMTHFHLAQTKRKIGETQEAKREYAKYLKLRAGIKPKTIKNGKVNDEDKYDDIDDYYFEQFS